MATKNNFFTKFFCLLPLFKATFTSFLKIKSHEEVPNRRNEGFSYYFLRIEGSGTGSRPRTNGSGSGRPKNIRIQIRIPNAVYKSVILKINALILLM
jgi:hypothetical protein